MNKADVQKLIDATKAEYESMCAERDRRNGLNVELQKELDVANAQAEAARIRAAGLADQIEQNWGRGGWIVLKKRIRMFADHIAELRRLQADLKD